MRILLAVLGSALLLCRGSLAFAQELPTTAFQKMVSDLAGVLSEVKNSREAGYILAKYVLEVDGKIGEKGARALLDAATKDRAVTSYSEHLKRILVLGQQAEKELTVFNTKFPEVPNYSHVGSYCAQRDASSDKIGRMSDAVRNLSDIRELASSYLGVYPKLRQNADVMRDYWNKVAPLAFIVDNGTDGIMFSQWQYWVDSHMGCGDCAGHYLVKGEEQWRRTAKMADSKIRELNEALKRFRAFHQHYYASEQQCLDPEESDSIDEFLSDAASGSLLREESSASMTALDRARERVSSAAEAPSVPASSGADRSVSDGLDGPVGTDYAADFERRCPGGAAKLQAIAIDTNRKHNAMREGACPRSELLEEMYRRIIAVYDSCPPDPEIRAARIEAEKL